MLTRSPPWWYVHCLWCRPTRSCLSIPGSCSAWALHSCPPRRSSDVRCDRISDRSRPARGEELTSRSAGRPLDRIGGRKSTRLNSSHVKISYAVFCLKKKKTSDRYLATATRAEIINLLTTLALSLRYD